MTRLIHFLVWAVLRLYAYTRPCADIAIDGELYMRRWFLTSRPPPESDETGTPGWYLQRIYREDRDRRLHCHPWTKATTRILRGRYEERREDEQDDYVHFIRDTGDTYTLWPTTYHRITCVWPNTWTLFHAGPKTGNGWGFR
jgi:hypothetical protein